MDLEQQLGTLDRILRGDRDSSGLTARDRRLEEHQVEAEERQDSMDDMVEERRSSKDQLKGAKVTLIVVGLLVGVAGGGLGLAVLETLGRVAAALPQLSVSPLPADTIGCSTPMIFAVFAPDSD